MSALSSRTQSVHADDSPSNKDAEKAGEEQQIAKPNTTLREDVQAAGLEKVYARHGRIDLVPLPSDDPQDPYNWAWWRKHALLLQVAFHAMMGPFSAAAVIPSFGQFSEEFGVSITQASYFVSVPILFLGTFPLLWGPVSARIGRRPVLLASAFLSAAMHFAGGWCTSYGGLMATRVFQGIALCPPQSIGANMVNEMFFLHEKGQKLGIWTLLTSLGPPMAPLLTGPLTYHIGTWRATFWFLAIINLVQFFLYLVLGPETIFDRPERGTKHEDTRWTDAFLKFRRRSEAPWARLPYETVRPLFMALQLPVILPSIAYAVVFSYTNVLLTVEIPALLGQKYELNEQQIGLQFVGAVVGAVLGELVAGKGSDLYVAWRTKRANGERQPEMRLPFALPGFILAAVGIIVFGVQLQNTEAGHWNVTPVIGVAVAIAGLQLVTTVVYAYSIESQPADRAPRVAPFVAFFRQLYAFTAPFYLPLAFERLGYASAAGLLAALAGGLGLLLVLACLLFGRKWRHAAS